MAAAPLALRVNSTASEPLGAAAARGLASSKATTAASDAGQGTFTAQTALTLYDANGNIRQVEDEPSAITRASLGAGDAAVVQVQGLNGSNATISVTVRTDGTYAALEHLNGATISYDSRSGAPPNSDEQTLANLAGKIAGLAGTAGSDATLASAAPTALNSLVQPGVSIEGLTVSVTDAKGVSQYVGGASGVVYAYRTGGDVALETVTIDDGVTTDSTRLLDGSGTTVVDGQDLNGTTFQLVRGTSGVETAEVSSVGGAFNDDEQTPVASSATDAFGDTVSVKGGAQGAIDIGLTDTFGNTFAFTNGIGGTQASLTVGVTVGGLSGTAKADLVAQDEATLTTGSIAHAAAALDAIGTSGKADGTLDVAMTDQVASTTSLEQTSDPLQPTLNTTASAGVGITAKAGGTLDVLGGAQGSMLDGAESDKGDLLENGATESGEGAEILQGDPSRTIVDVNVQALAEDKRNNATPKDSATADFGQIAVSAFGHRSDGDTSEEIDRADDVAYLTSRPDSILF